MTSLDFSIAPGPQQPIRDVYPPRVLRFDIHGLQPVVSSGEKVAPGELLAETPVQGRPELHAPLAGTVRSSSCSLITMEVAEEQPESGVAPLEGLDDPQLSPEKLAVLLAKLGVDPEGLHPAPVLVVNTLEPEPMVSVNAALLEHERDTVLAGLEFVRRMVRPGREVLLAAQRTRPILDGMNVVPVRPVYPAGLPALAREAAAGTVSAEEVVTADVLQLYRIGRVALTKRPLLESVATINHRNFRLPFGTPAGHLLRQAELAAAYADRVAFGGPMRGEPARNLDQGFPREAYGVFVVPAEDFPPTVDAPCINCGECVLACPARIRPELITKHAEFGKFEGARSLDIDCCIECGLCGFVCPARRPMLQHIRLAKAELAAQEEAS
jgi:electron transport complex protein RnfC